MKPAATVLRQQMRREKAQRFSATGSKTEQV
jgi:hypothetical protein